MNADYKVQGNKLYYYEKIRVNITFPVNNTTPKINSTDVRIPSLKEYKLKTIILSENEFLNLLSTDRNLDNAWTQIKTYHYVKNENYPNNDQNYYNGPKDKPQIDANEVVAPPIYLQPPTYLNSNVMRISKDKQKEADDRMVAPSYTNPKYPEWLPTITGVNNHTVWTVLPSNNRQYVPPPTPPPMPYNYNYPTNHQDNNHYRPQSTIHTTSYYNYDYPSNGEVTYNYHMNDDQYQPEPGNYGRNSGPSQPMNHYHNHNHGNYPDKNGDNYPQYYSNQYWSNNINNYQQTRDSQTIRNKRRGW